MGPSHVPSGDDRLGIGDAARMVGVAVETFRRWSNEGKIRSYRTPGGQRRFRRADVEKLREQDHADAAEQVDEVTMPTPRTANTAPTARTRGAA